MQKIFDWIQDHLFLSFLLALVTLAIGCFFAIDAEGERQWEAYCQEARARGVAISLEEIIPPPVPDEENFAALSLFRSAFEQPSKPVVLLPKLSEPLPGFGDALKREPVPWKMWQNHLQAIGWLKEASQDPVRDILRALDEHASLMKEWNDGLARPKTRFSLDYPAGMAMKLPHIGIFKDAARLHHLRVHAYLELNDGVAALAEWQNSLATLQKLDDEPNLVSQVIRNALLNMSIEAVGAGLEQHRWNEQQLREIMDHLAKIEMLRPRQRSIEGERAGANHIYEMMAKSGSKERERLLSGIISESTEGAWLFRLITRRMVRDSQLRHNRFLDEVTAQADPKTGKLHWQRATPSILKSPSSFEKLYYMVFYVLAPAYGTVDQHWVHLQARIEQCRTACALEGFHQEHGRYPVALQDLVPSWLERIPADPFSDQPMIYRTNEHGYLLYCVGPDGLDDEARTSPEVKESEQPDFVWRQIPAARVVPVPP